MKSIEANQIQFGKEHEEAKKDYQREIRIIFFIEIFHLDDIFVIINLE